MRVLCLLAAGMLSACGGGDPPAPPRTFAVTYEIEGDLPQFRKGLPPEKAFLTYALPNGATEQKLVTLPYKVGEFFPYTAKVGDFLYISAQKQESGSSVGVTIKADGVSIGSASSSAPFGIASVSKSCC